MLVYEEMVSKNLYHLLRILVECPEEAKVCEALESDTDIPLFILLHIIVCFNKLKVLGNPAFSGG